MLNKQKNSPERKSDIIFFSKLKGDMYRYILQDALLAVGKTIQNEY